MLSNPEIETLILINRSESQEGFFRVSTSNRAHFNRILINRILKRVGKNVLNIREIRHSNKTIQWEVKIPVKYLSKTNFGIRKEKGSFKELKEAKKGQSPGGTRG